MGTDDEQLNEKLEVLRDSFDTTLLLDVVNDFPDDLREDVFKLHTLAMEVVNYDNNDKAAKFFAMADDLSSELYDVIERYERLKQIVDSITEHDPGLDYDYSDDDEDE